jgi:hypothetical protein
MKIKNRKLKYTNQVKRSVEWWLRGITDPLIKENAFNNACNLKKLTNKLSEALSIAFTWSESPEGQIYWENYKKEIKKEENAYSTILTWINGEPDVRVPIIEYIVSYKTHTPVDKEGISSIIETLKETKEQEQEPYDAPKFNVEALKKK